MKDLPDVVNEINKQYKTIKITTLSRAKSFNLQRFFSGSFNVDHIVGGGFAYRRLQLLYGARSSGKNALLNQTIAYNQRLCRTCQGVHPEYSDTSRLDMWSKDLMYLLGVPKCTCSTPEFKIAYVFDYERSLAKEVSRPRTMNKIIDKTTGQELDELDYNDKCVEMSELSEAESLTDEQTTRMKDLEKYFDNVKIETYLLPTLPTYDYLEKCGVIIDRLLVADPEDTEEGIDMMIPLIKSKEADIIIWDSLQAAIPRRVKDRDADQATMGVEAKQNGLLMRQVCSAFSAANLEDESESFKPAIFITSQVRANLNAFVGGPDSFSGGKAVEHHISLALELKREHFLRADGTKADFKDDLYGQKVRLRAEKNKLSSPGSVYEFDYYFKDGENYPIGIDHTSEIVGLGVKLNFIERAGPYYSVNGEKFQGMPKLVEFFRQNPSFVGEVYSKIKSIA